MLEKQQQRTKEKGIGYEKQPRIFKNCRAMEEEKFQHVDA
jgi:hypothetical protein